MSVSIRSAMAAPASVKTSISTGALPRDLVIEMDLRAEVEQVPRGDKRLKDVSFSDDTYVVSLRYFKEYSYVYGKDTSFAIDMRIEYNKEWFGSGHGVTGPHNCTFDLPRTGFKMDILRPVRMVLRNFHKVGARYFGFDSVKVEYVQPDGSVVEVFDKRVVEGPNSYAVITLEV